MFCRKCGKEFPDDSMFCPKCGTAVFNEKEPEVPETIQKAKKTVNDNAVFHDIEDSPYNNKPKASGEDEVVEQRNHRKTAIIILIIAALLIAVALIIIIPQAGIGFEYKLLENERYAITKYTGSGGEVTIPDTIWFKPVTVISQSAFQDSNITNVWIGKNIIGIGESAFKDCASLEKLVCSAVEMKDNSNFLIMNKAFSGCTALKKVTLPNSGIVIGNEAFYNCSSLELIQTGSRNPNYTAEIGAAGKKSVIESEAFSGCSSLKSLLLENVNIGKYTFSECTGLTDLCMNGGSLGEEAFKNCTQLKSAKISFSSVREDEHIKIPDKCFAGCTALECFSGKNISVIGDKAFLNCAALSEFNLDPYPTDISATALDGCIKLKKENNQNNNSSVYHEFAATNFIGVPEDEAVRKLGNYYIFDYLGYDWYRFDSKGISFGVGQGTHKMELFDGAYVSSGFGAIDNVRIGMTLGEIFSYIGRQNMYVSEMNDSNYYFTYKCGEISLVFYVNSPAGYPNDNCVVHSCWVNDRNY